MPRFKNLDNENIIEVPEDHAEQVLRKSRNYIEVEHTVEESRKCPVESAQTESIDSVVETAGTPPKRSVGRPKKRTTQKRTNAVSKG